MQDYLSGIFTILEFFLVGGEIEITGIRGKVEDFILRRIVFKYKDKLKHHIPNS